MKLKKLVPAALSLALVLSLAACGGGTTTSPAPETDSPAASMADVVLLCGGHERPLQTGSIAAKMAMLFVVDMLVNEFCRRDMDTTMRNKDLTANALAIRHL